MNEIRQFSPVIGELWDTLEAVAGHAMDLHDQVMSVTGGQGVKGVSSAVPADSPDRESVAPLSANGGPLDVVDADD